MFRPPRRSRPPKRRCQVCGGDVYTWRMPPVHPGCVREPGLADLMRDERMRRRKGGGA